MYICNGIYINECTFEDFFWFCNEEYLNTCILTYLLCTHVCVLVRLGPKSESDAAYKVYNITNDRRLHQGAFEQ